jgi:hypothetical protein
VGLRGNDLEDLGYGLLLACCGSGSANDVAHIWSAKRGEVAVVGTLGGKADQKGEQNVVSMNSLSTMPCARLMTGHDSMPRLNLKSPGATYNAGVCERCCAQPICGPSRPEQGRVPVWK